MRKIVLYIALAILCGCASRTAPDQSDSIVSVQIIDRNGFTETISNKDRLKSYQSTDFSAPQPYQKVLRVFGRNAAGQSSSKITSYHDNGHLWQFLEVIDGRAHGVYQEWFPNGQIKIEAHLIEGVADIHDLAQATWVFAGLCTVWNDQGNLIAEFNYEKGVLQNSARYFFPSGKLQKIIPYEQGEVHGILQAFDENGNLIEEAPYMHGEKDGDAIAYWAPENLLSKETYERGRLFDASYYDATGKCVAEIKGGRGKQAQFKDDRLQALVAFSDGVPEGEVQLFHPNGMLHCSYNVKDGKKNGEEWEYYTSGMIGQQQPKLSVNWNDDQIQGLVKTWYPNGQIESQREFNGNKKQGVSFAWYKSGDLMLVEEYENDLLIKGSYYKKGDKKVVSKIESGKGVASLYTSDGILLKKVSYEKGKPQLNQEPSLK
jgi:antitoxin component YwqK of YwqJK toxin-antitoxin module